MKITEAERDELVRRVNVAKTTPMIVVGMTGSKDLSTMAWERVQNYMDELGQRYSYDPKKYAVNSETCEVVEYS